MKRLQCLPLLSLLSVITLSTPTNTNTASSKSPTAAVLNGTYSGLHLPSFNQDGFLGMPYAQDTGGQNRFRIPQALATSWSGVRDATQYGPACPDISPEDWTYGVGEDCLSINVVKPSGEIGEQEGLPVALWIHGELDPSQVLGETLRPN